MSKRIEIIIDKDGGVKIEAFGFQGDDCLVATAPFERALGTVDSRTRKHDVVAEETLREEQHGY